MSERAQGSERLAFNVTEAAACLGVSRPTMYELLRREDFPSFRIGTRRLIPRDGLAAWVEKQGALRSEV